MAVDLEAATLAVEPGTLVVINGQAATSDGKSNNASRLLSLDPVTVAALRDWLAVQRSERVFFDRDYLGADRVVTWENGRDVRHRRIEVWDQSEGRQRSTRSRLGRIHAGGLLARSARHGT